MKSIYFSLTLCTLMFTLHIFGQPAFDALVYNKAHTIQFWRIISCHFIHIDNLHLLYNLLACFVLSVIIEKNSCFDLLLIWLTGIIGVSIYIIYALPYAQYAGASGVLHALYVYACYQLYKQKQSRMILLYFIAMLIKTSYELLTQSSLLTALDWPPLPAAHVAGIISATILCLIQELTRPFKALYLNQKTSRKNAKIKTKTLENYAL